ncbi:hypothetical protein GCM10007978_35950 [Shewanella hanedai]|nr:hypothetical protein GCM10007978_35950 [Shewanella hanedai]
MKVWFTEIPPKNNKLKIKKMSSAFIRRPKNLLWGGTVNPVTTPKRVAYCLERRGTLYDA